MVNMVPQMASLGWVSYFFSGFVLSKHYAYYTKY
jgi:hypothetical protein